MTAEQAKQERWSLGDSINEHKDGSSWIVPVWANEAPAGDRMPAEARGSTREIARDRARLIAAAPETAAERDALRELCGELAAALERIVSEAKDPSLPRLAADMIIAAVARAREMGVGQ